MIDIDCCDYIWFFFRNKECLCFLIKMIFLIGIMLDLFIIMLSY